MTIIWNIIFKLLQDHQVFPRLILSSRLIYPSIFLTFFFFLKKSCRFVDKDSLILNETKKWIIRDRKANVSTSKNWTILIRFPKIHYKSSDLKIFISHIPVTNFTGTALQITPRMGTVSNSAAVRFTITTSDSWLSFSNPSSSNVQGDTSSNFNVQLIGGKNLCILSHLRALQEDTVL